MAKKLLKKKVIKKAVKKAVKKPAKKAIKKVVPTRKTSRGSSILKSKIGIKSLPKRKPIGAVTHFYDKICVAIVKFDQEVAVGEEICFEGPKNSFSQVLESMQYEHQPIQKVEKGQEVGVKVKKKVKEGHRVYKA